MGDDEIVDIFKKFIHVSQSLDPNIEMIKLAENKSLNNMYFKDKKQDSRIICFSFESEINKDKKIFTYRNVKINEEEDSLVRKCYLLEIFFTVPMRYDIQTIKIQDFPIDKIDMNEYLEDYNKSYQKRVIPQKEVFSTDNLILRSGVYQITIVRKNHFVPYGYLKEFQCENKPGFVYNFKLNENIFDENSGNKPVKIENVLYLPHYYSLGIELILKIIEDNFYSIRDKIVSSKSVRDLSQEEKLIIVRYIFAQYIRTPLERNRFIYVAKAIFNKFYELKFKENSDNEDIIVKFNDMYIRLMVEDDMFNFLYPSSKEQLKLPNFYLECNWKLVSSEHMEFYTSDNPVILFNNSYKLNIDQNYIQSLKKPNSKLLETKRPHGLMEPGIQLYFPISPRLCILIYHPVAGQVILDPVRINEQILIQCHQNIISSNKMVRSFLRRKLKQKQTEREKISDLNSIIKEY